MKPIVIFGIGQIAEVVHFYFTVDAQRSVAAFTVDQAYLDRTEFCGCPVVPFETVVERYPPEEFDLFVATGYAKNNRVREEKYKAAKQLGYVMTNYVSSKANFWPGLVVGENCLILEGNTIQPFVEVGSNVFIWSGNHIGHHAKIGDNVFISSHVVVAGGVHVGRNCFIGVNATLRDHIQVGELCVIGAGAVVTRDLDNKSVIMAAKSVLSKITSDRLLRI